MKIKILSFFTFLLLAVGVSKANIPGDWKVYPTFDNQVFTLVDSPDKVYMVANGVPYIPSNPTLNKRQSFLFVYDKEDDELLPYSRRNYLSDNLINALNYNGDKGYLLVVYDNYNIDIIDDNGNVHNIPGLMSSNITQSKNVNDICFDPDNDCVYLATDFGYLVINDKKYEISESRVYGTPLKSAGRVGDSFVIFDSDKAMSAPYSSPRLSLEAFGQLEGLESPTSIMPMTDGTSFFAVNANATSIVKVTLDGTSAPKVEKVSGMAPKSISRTRDGYMVSGAGSVYLLGRDGSKEHILIPDEYAQRMGCTWDGKDFWFGIPREGLRGLTRDGNNWTVTHESMRPDTPNVMKAQWTAYHPQYGMLVNNHGINRIFGLGDYVETVCLSGLKDGFWTSYGTGWRNKDRLNGNFVLDPDGVVFDPDDPKYVYMGSRGFGMLRLNLEDSEDILHMSRSNDPDNGNPGFHTLFDFIPEASQLCPFSAPKFDNEGNLWTLLLEMGGKLPEGKGAIWVWPKSKRQAGDPSGWVSYDLKGISGFTKGLEIQPLTHQNNKNLAVIIKGVWDTPLFILDHNGTVEDPSDDTFSTLGTIYDQDGTSVDKHYVYTLYEDPNTGYVWAGTYNGVFYFNPKTALTNPQSVYRVKVSRNDGTNLADYLLDNVKTYKIIGDGQGRLWFGTLGGGVFCTSADGKEVYAQFTTENSYLPSNDVYGLGYNPSTNSIMISTDSGMCEFFMAGSSSGADFAEARAYPNPVRPDYLGWVTIDGLVDNALVKIVDAAGNLVTELGRAEAGCAKWDVCNAEGRRVNTGVYYVAMSSSADGGNLARVAKILVVK